MSRFGGVFEQFYPNYKCANPENMCSDAFEGGLVSVLTRRRSLNTVTAWNLLMGNYGFDTTRKTISPVLNLHSFLVASLRLLSEVNCELTLCFK